jgi:Transposase DDE domain group 1
MANPMRRQRATQRVLHGKVEVVADEAVIADTFAGRVHVEWDETAAVTPLGQLPFFVEFVKQAGLFDAWVAGSPLRFTSPNAPAKRDVLGTALLGVLAGCWRYAHLTALRGDAVNPQLLGMGRVVSEDAVRRGLKSIEPSAGEEWMCEHLLHCVRPLLGEPWILDVDTTVKPLYGHQQGAEVGYNPQKRGRPSHSLHTYVMANLRLVLDVEVRGGKQHASRHSQDGLWRLLKALPKPMWPRMVRGDSNWGTDPVMRRCEEEGLAYLLRLRLTANVKRALDRAMSEQGWTQAGQGWQGKEAWLKLHGWGRARRVILLRRRLKGGVSLAARNAHGQLALGFATVEADEAVWEHGALVTSLSDEILSFGQLYRDRADCENVYDEMKNQWGWGGFTTHDLARCQLMARIVALAYNWWTLFSRLAEPDRHREAITGRPLMMHAIARRTEHAGRTTLTITSTHGDCKLAERAYRRIARFLASVRTTAEQLTPLQRLYRILSEAMRHFLNGRQLRAPPGLQAA